jgi:hypothetical protein
MTDYVTANQTLLFVWGFVSAMIGMAVGVLLAGVLRVERLRAIRRWRRNHRR